VGREITKDNQIYYFRVGQGRWVGRFGFALNSWGALRGAPIGAKNQLLAASMAILIRLTGRADLESVIGGDPDAGEAGVATNVVRITRLGATLYLLRETYTLAADGVRVSVEANERFGPIPGILSRHFTYLAEIHDGGTRSVYHMPLLGSPWLAQYKVADDKRHLSGELVCDWAQATENIARTGA
jgi:hypothetical protein